MLFYAFESQGKINRRQNSKANLTDSFISVTSGDSVFAESDSCPLIYDCLLFGGSISRATGSKV